MNDHTPFDEGARSRDDGHARDGMDASNDGQDAFAAQLRHGFASDPTPPHGDDFWSNLTADLAAESPGRADLAPIHAPSEVGAPGLLTLDLPMFDRDHFEPPHRRDRSSAVLVAAAMCAVVVLGGLFVAGNRSDEMPTTTVASPPLSATDIISPLIRLHSNPATSALNPSFSVRTTKSGGVYTRLITVEQFDGNTWSSQSDYADPPAFGPIDAALLTAPAMQVPGAQVPALIEGGSPGAGDVEPVPRSLDWPVAEYVLFDQSLLTPWLPVPAGTFAIDTLDSGRALYSQQNESWTQAGDGEAFTTYTALFNDDFPILMAHQTPSVELPDDRYVELPDDFSEAAGALATELTAGAQSDLDRAIILENYFRSEFNYDPETSSPTQSIEDFLESQSGNVEAFAGTYAAMLRSLGIPSRVAVGFLPGTEVEDDPGLFIVRQGDAHAWTEVYLGSMWFRFDPTPTRGVSTGSPELPAMNRDHWHSVYGLYDCRSESYLDAFDSTNDPLGIHSHQDGLIHIHPFFESAAGANAVLGLFLDAMDAELTEAGLASPLGSLPAMATCDGQEAVLHLRKWQFDFLVDSSDPQIVVDNIESVRFVNDREVYVLALAPLDAELPPIPGDRFDQLDDVAGAIVSTGAD